MDVMVDSARRRFTAGEFERMGEAGILRDERLELIEGEILRMSPIGSRHAAVVERLGALLQQKLGERAPVRRQNPVRLEPESEPQPDVAVVKPRPDFYASAHPGPADVFLLVEVAETTADFDRGRKAPVYARCGIPETWIVLLERGVVEVRRGGDVLEAGRDGRLAPLAFPEAALDIAAFLL